MNQEVEETLKSLLFKCLAKIHDVRPSYQLVTDPYLEYRRGDGDQSWNGKPVDKICMPYFPNLRTVFSEEVKQFSKMFLLHYPSYMNWIGISGFSLESGSSCLERQLSIYNLIAELIKRHSRLYFSTDEIDEIIKDFSTFVDASEHLIRYKAILLNYSMQPDEIRLTEHIIIRKLNETEVSELYGGFYTAHPCPYDQHRIHDCVLEGEFKEPLIHSDPDLDIQHRRNPVENIVVPNLNRAVLALRTFKSGHIGYETIDFDAVGFCPIGFGTALRPSPRVEIGDYRISESESVELKNHSKMLFGQLDPVLEVACAKLSESETRTSDKDRILGAVVGLESILLAGLGSGGRGELKFRFSLNYSTLFDDKEDKAKQYRIAKDLYDIRSKIAHGSESQESHRLGNNKLTMSEIAEKAREILRNTIKLFLPEACKSPYKKPEYWENGYFGIEPRI